MAVSWPPNVKRLCCESCGRHHMNIVPNAASPQGALRVYWRCRCGHYNEQEVDCATISASDRVEGPSTA